MRQGRRHKVCMAGLSIVLIGCAKPRGLDIDSARVRTAIDSLNAQISRWYAAGESDSLAHLYALDAVLFVPNKPPIVGRDSIAAHKRLMLSGADWDVTLDTRELKRDGNLVVEHGQYTIELSIEGATPGRYTDRGHYLGVWNRTADGWRISYDMSVSEKRSAE